MLVLLLLLLHVEGAWQHSMREYREWCFRPFHASVVNDTDAVVDRLLKAGRR